jgi:hypothetical protein
MSFKHYLNQSLNESVPHQSKLTDRTITWLEEQVYDPMAKLYFNQANWAGQKPLEDLFSKFGNETEVKVYYGLNFKDESDASDFRRAAKRGKYEFKYGFYALDKKEDADVHAKDLMPWTTNAYEYRNSKDHMHGHAGVVLEITIPPHNVVDLHGHISAYFQDPKNKKIRDFNYLVNAGTYSIKIVENHLPLKAQVNKYNFKEHFMKIKSLGRSWYGHDEDKMISPQDESMFAYIQEHFDFNDPEMSAHLFKLCSKKVGKSEPEIKVKENKEDDKWRFEDEDIIITITSFFPWQLIYYYVDFNESDKAKLDKMAIKEIKLIDKKYHEEISKLDKELHEYWVKIQMSGCTAELVAIEEYFDHADFVKHFNKSLVERYHQLNSPEEIKRINKSANQKEEINAHGKRVAATLNQIINSERSKRNLKRGGRD